MTEPTRAQQIADDIREQKAMYPAVDGIDHIHAISLIRICRGEYLTDAEKLARIRDILAGLDIVQKEAVRDLDAWLTEIRAARGEGA